MAQHQIEWRWMAHTRIAVTTTSSPQIPAENGGANLELATARKDSIVPKLMAENVVKKGM
jgi:hypothetical protein